MILSGISALFKEVYVIFVTAMFKPPELYKYK